MVGLFLFLAALMLPTLPPEAGALGMAMFGGSLLLLLLLLFLTLVVVTADKARRK
jgi:hypothetical protein